MIRKHKVFAKSWELEEAKPVQPFPAGIAAHTDTLPPGITSDEWRRVMGKSDTWGRAADEMTWANEIKSLCSAIENISYAVDSVLAKVEEGQTLDLLTLEVVKKQFDKFAEIMVYHEEQVMEKVFPFLEPKLEDGEAKRFKVLEKCYSQRQKRTALVRKALEKGIDKLNLPKKSQDSPGPTLKRLPSGTGQGIFIMRLVKDNLDVFQSIYITAMQMEVETAMWLVRSKLSEKEWLANAELGTKTPWDLEKLGFMACQDTDGLLKPLSLDARAQRLSSHMPYPVAYASGCLLCVKHHQTWTKPILKIAGSPSVSEQAFKTASRETTLT